MNKTDKSEIYNPYGGIDIELPHPPPCYTVMNATLVGHKPGIELTVAFPVLESFLNPAGTMQGGFITAAFDNVFGPLCYDATKTPASSMVHINTSFHRPVFPGDELTIIARVKTKGKRIVHMDGEAYNRENKLVASAHCDYMITG
ncbi:MAG TPA: PaaI family thioesterase [Spirochaetota bacterium]|nr:PaaI family thioesterase [Spirochaetota bacterium]HPF06377.1 PaaI family thioesterase [Spirochaetota bacterium]HPJ43245.1 PaaI family thioesterase [Spirochaetota bacterium]HRX49420.1 PaaI family thioesterase [Spirochaetota bacterium]